MDEMLKKFLKMKLQNMLAGRAAEKDRKSVV